MGGNYVSDTISLTEISTIPTHPETNIDSSPLKIGQACHPKGKAWIVFQPLMLVLQGS